MALNSWDHRYLRCYRRYWDSGIVAPELRALVESGALRPGSRTLDVGCGTGTNTLWLASQGFAACGVDLSRLAIGRARRRAQAARLAVEGRDNSQTLANTGRAIFYSANILTRHSPLVTLSSPFALVLDLGCFHTLEAADRLRYASVLRDLTSPGSQFLLYAFCYQAGPAFGVPGISPVEVETLFDDFTLRWRQDGSYRQRPTAWYLLERQL